MLALLLLLAAIVVSFFVIRPIVGYFTSAGGEVVTVPSLAGMAEDDAVAELRGTGLIAKIHTDYNDEQESGVVFKQNPPPGATRKKGGKVNLFVSLGPANFIVPDLIGEHINKVRQRLAAAGLTLGTVEKVFSEDRPAGRVVNQDPKRGRVYSNPLAVDIVIADSGNLPVLAMPSLRGLSLASAERMLVRPDISLRLGKVAYVANDEAASGTVVSQDPAAGKQVQLGGKVEVEVAIPAALKEARNKTLDIRIPIPRGPETQRVKIKVYDALGEQIAYDAQHSPRDLLNRRIEVEGKATILIFICDMANPYREEHL